MKTFIYIINQQLFKAIDWFEVLKLMVALLVIKSIFMEIFTKIMFFSLFLIRKIKLKS